MSDLFRHSSFDDHEQVLFVSDKQAGFQGIIAIHSTALGPAAGGCRMFPYQSTDEALTDVLRLSRGMSLKNSAAGLPLGGGKCVVIADPDRADKDTLLRAMARHVQRLNGRYWTAIDVGVSAADADTMAEECDFIFAKASEFEKDFQPSAFTSLGGFHAVRAMAQYLRGHDDLQGLSVAVQGAGQAGAGLISLLSEQGVKVFVADIDKEKVDDVVRRYGATAVSKDDILTLEVDVFSPCAMGGVLNEANIQSLRCSAIAGLANNQLKNSDDGERLLAKNIAYAPDFVANAGGVMGATMPIFSKPDTAASHERVAGIYDALLTILEESNRLQIPSETIAENMAMARINSAVKS